MTQNQKAARAIAILLMGLTALISVHTADFNVARGKTLQCNNEICTAIPKLRVRN
jgi:hypothetical protein